MKLRARLSSNVFARKLRNADAAVRDAVLDTAAHALQEILQHSTLSSVSVETQASRRIVGSHEPQDAERELGTLTQSPSPWLAPVLPTALEPMRAAAKTAAARAVSAIGKRKN